MARKIVVDAQVQRENWQEIGRLRRPIPGQPVGSKFRVALLFQVKGAATPRHDFIDTHLKRFTPQGYAEWHWPKHDGFDMNTTVAPAGEYIPPGTRIDRISPFKV